MLLQLKPTTELLTSLQNPIYHKIFWKVNYYLYYQTVPKSRQLMVLTVSGGQNIHLTLTVNIRSMQPMLDLTMSLSTMEL